MFYGDSRLFKFKDKIKKMTFHKRQNYILKESGILFIVLLLVVILTLYHIILDGSNFLALFSKLGLDISIILIPALLASSNIREKFKLKKDLLFSLKEKLINLRYEIAKTIIVKVTPFEVTIPIDSKEGNLVLYPIIVNEIKDQLRKFGFHDYADKIGSYVQNKTLFWIDQILIEVIKLTKYYDKGEAYNSLKNGYFGRKILKRLEEFKESNFIYSTKGKIPKKSYIRHKILENVIWAIVYELFFDVKNKAPISIYYDFPNF